MKQKKKAEQNPTPAEVRAREIIYKYGNGCNVWFQYVHFQTTYRIDFFFKEWNVAIEIDGSSHVEENDRHRDAVLFQYGIRTYRFKNEDVLVHPANFLLGFNEICRKFEK